MCCPSKVLTRKRNYMKGSKNLMNSNYILPWAKIMINAKGGNA
jgi:hypothetical protein